MKKAKIRLNRLLFSTGTRIKAGNQRYIVQSWCGMKGFSLDNFFDPLNPTIFLGVHTWKVSHSFFYELITKILPEIFRKKSPCSSLLRIHNCSANYSYDILIEPNRIMCIPKPVGYVINLKRRKSKHYETP